MKMQDFLPGQVGRMNRKETVTVSPKNRLKQIAKVTLVLLGATLMVLLISGPTVGAITNGVWSLNNDLPSPSNYVNALIVYNGKLYAGTCCAGAIYVYDGSTWALNFIVDNGASGAAQIHSFAVYNGKLYAGTNYFESAQNRGRVWVYDGTTWSINQDFLPDNSIHHYFSLAVYNGKLYAGTGDQGNIRVFDGTTWSGAFNTGQAHVWSLATYNGKLYAGTCCAGLVYVYDGVSWSLGFSTGQAIATALAVHNGKLYAGTGNNGIIYAFDGIVWTPSFDSGEQQITALVSFDNKLYAGGLNQGTVYIFDGNTWSPSFASGENAILALASYGNKLYAGSSVNGKVFQFHDPSTPFASFTTKLEIKLNPGVNDDTFEVKSTFTLANGSNGINPLTEPVTLRVGNFSTTIPAGSFKQDKKGQFKFEGTISGISLEAKVIPLGGNKFEFRAEGKNVNLTGIVNPVNLELAIGDDRGTATVTAEIK
jgi:hypothetical protein